MWATQTLDTKSLCKRCQGALYLTLSCWDSTVSDRDESRDVHPPRLMAGQGCTSGYPWAAHVKSDIHSISIPWGRATLPGAFRKPCGAQGRRKWSPVLMHSPQALRRKCCCKRLSHLPECLRKGAEANSAPEKRVAMKAHSFL